MLQTEVVMKIFALQHVPFEGPAEISSWATVRGKTLIPVKLFAGDQFPQLSDDDMLVIMGGPMSVNDESVYPWLSGEKEFVCKAVSRGVKTLGICLGSQIIASALGARVYKNSEKEIGWFPVTRLDDNSSFSGLDLPDTLTPFHWHGETFDLPKGARHLYSTQICANQSFAIGDSTLGFQFHLEMNATSIAGMIVHCREELVGGGGYVQNAVALNKGFAAFNGRNRKFLFELLDKFSGYQE
jgi:GMP synthase-like glutamine amidotransferase